MNDPELKKILKAGKPTRKSVERGLYFRVSAEGNAFWVLRFMFNGKRKEITLGRYGNKADELTLKQARDKAAETRLQVNQGLNPIAEKKRPKRDSYISVDDIANKWLIVCERELKNPQIPRRVYEKEISPIIGGLSIKTVEPLDILAIVEKINASGRPSIANDALAYCKQIFNRAIKEGAIKFNPAGALSIKDAGGSEKSRSRYLSKGELEIVLRTMRENSHLFTRDNYLAFCLLVTLGVRKGELIAAKWDEFDFNSRVWHLPKERTKTGKAISIPIPEELLAWLKELSVRANGSEYLFPSRRASKRRGYISDDTLNHALAKLFGNKGYIKKSKKELPNILGEQGVEHFVIHDLRRTCRSLLSELRVAPHIAEKCLNHKIKGVEAIYDHYDYFDERKAALTKLASKIKSIA
ncbi:putative prophage CPS-53 integrase [Vibrio crassostreae]|uniref:tyrosine-type recombinase/integrase n=1 Tax=Vibrio crassostreae TaxID=246167 RepID=UPI001B3035E4|nr:site-specific integrase [Vibrio crassostreae]CAK2028835.1 putative prophage CPS-53 integrase [Vibrio crassostreae]CAK2032706.1 putative prophage CPS-53 integrase [Vibrio crassostreae]CAK2032977.1 putative prophage CPS-53 integrase [Vibrio crassostreae]CAK2034217.1 putative prophage CPS-53 integrase [Vibrio crassostreae]CAK2037042.1 putative prophage CPS-53 integrase [Vibrio crassostreae]